MNSYRNRAHRLTIRTVVVRISRKLRATYRLRTGRLFSSLLAALVAAFSPLARALPEGATVTSGQVGISTPTANSMVLNQTTPKAILDWQTFSIGQGQSVQFIQPGATSVALNRVNGGSASAIYGSLSANGQVFLVNPAGVLFAPGAQVNVGGLVASTLGLSNSDFLNGNYQFSGTGGGSVVNQGSLKGRYVVLAAPQVTNAGSIDAQRGSVGLLAGSRVTVDPSGAGLVKFSVDAAAVNAALTNSGAIVADGGQVALLASALSDTLPTVINQSGVIRANSIANENGTIVLSGGATGVVKVSGTLEARGANAGETGGTVKVLGDRVGLMAGAKIDASGDAGGGTVLVGGNYQGQGAEQKASSSFVATGATVRADAVNNGDGGKVVVWSDGSTAVGGSISARGGASGGRGGVVETSGKEHLTIADSAQVDTSAAKGAAGSWLLDPVNIVVAASGAAALGDVDQFSDSIAAEPATVAAGTINAAASTVVLQAKNDITFSSAVAMTNNGVGLVAQAGHDINVNASISTTNGSVILSANDSGGTATGTGRVSVGATINTGTAGVSITNNGSSSANVLGSSVTAGGTIGITGASTLSAATTLTGSAISTGNITGSQNLGLTAAGGVTAGSIGVSGLTTASGTSLGASDVTTTGVASLGGNVTTSGAAGQSYNSTTLTNNVTLATGAAANAVRLGAVTGGGNNLSVTSGNTTIASTVTSLGTLQITNGLTTTGAVGAGKVAVTGAASLGGDVVTTGAQQSYGSVSLNGNAKLQDMGGATIALGSSVTGNGRNLQLVSGGGASSTGAISGVGLLTTNSGTSVSATDIAASTASIGGNVTATTGNVAIATSTTLTANATVSANGGAGSIGLGAVTGGNKDLTLTGNATLGTSFGIAALRANQALTTTGTLQATSVAVTGAATLGGNVTTSLGQSYTGGAILNAASVSLTDSGNSAITVGTGLTGGGNNLTVVSGGTTTLTNATGIGTFTAGTNGTTNGSITAATYNLKGGTVNATLGTGTLNQVSGTTTLNGTSAADTVNVNGGTLSTGAADRLADTAAVTVVGGTTLALGGNEAIGSLAGAGAVSLGANTLATGGNNASTTFSGTASGSGGLTKEGLGTLTLSGASNYTGATTVNAGTLSVWGGAVADTSAAVVASGATINLTGAETFGSLAGAGNIATNGNILFTGGNNTSTTFSGVISGTGGLQKFGSGNQTLTGVNTYTGVTTVASGTLTVNGTAISDVSAVTVNGGGTLALTGSETVGSLAGIGNVSLGANTLTAGGDNSTTSFSGVISGAGGALAKAGIGTLTLSGANNYSGGTTVSGGNLTVRNSVLPSGNVAIASGAVLQYDNQTGGLLALRPGTYTGTGTLRFSGNAGASTSVGGAGGNVNISLGSGGLVDVVSGRVAGSSTDQGFWTGNRSDLYIAAGATFDGVEGTIRVNALNGAGSLQGGWPGRGSVTVGVDNGSGTFTGTMSDNGSGGMLSLGKEGSGTQILTGTGTYTGTTTISGGTLQIGNGGTTGTLGTGAITVTGATLAVNRSDTLTIANSISGTGGVTQAGTGQTILAGTNTYGGATTINAGMLSVGGTGIGDASAVTVNGSGTLALTGSETIGSLSGGGYVDLGTNTLTAGGNNTSTTYSGYAYGSGGLTKEGSGTLTLGGSNGYTGATTVNAGTLSVWGGAVADNSALVVASGATVNLTGAETFGSIAGAGNIATNGNTLFTGGDGTSTTFSGVISGTGNLYKFNGGNLTLTGVNTYTGATEVAGGTLTVNGAAIADASAVTVGSGATLALAGSETIGSLEGSGNVSLGANTLTVGGNSNSTFFFGTASGTGGLTKEGFGTLALYGTNTYTGATTVNAGTLALAHPTDTLSGSSAVSVATGATLDIGGNSDTVGSLALAGTLAGTGTLTAATYTLDGGTVDANLGTGTLVQASGSSALNGTSAAGTVNISGGTLLLGSTANRLTAPSTVTIAPGAVLLTGFASQSFGTATIGNSGTLATDNTLQAGSIAGPGVANLGGAVITTGAAGQSYGTTVLHANASLDAGAANPIQLGTVIGNGYNLGLTGMASTSGASGLGTLYANQDLTVNGNVSATSVTVAGTAHLAGDVTTTGTQVYAATDLAASVALSGSSLNLSAVTGNGQDLSLTGNTSANAIAGVGRLTTSAGTAINASSVAVSSASLGGDVTTTGSQTYAGPVALTADATLAGAGVTFGGTVTGPQALTVNTTGGTATTFNGVVDVASLTTNADGRTVINGGTVTTTGTQTYNDALVLGANTTLDAGAGDLVFNGGVDGGFALTATSSGITRLNTPVGAGTALSSLTTNGGGFTFFEANVTTSGAQTYSDAIALNQNATLTGSDVTLGGRIDGAHALTVNASGATTFNGVVNVGTLTTDTAGSTVVNGGSVATSVAQTFNDPVVLGANAVFNGVTGTVAFNNTVDGPFALTAQTSGPTSFAAPVGSATPLASFATTGGGSTSLAASVTTTLGQNYSDAITLAAPTIALTSTGSGTIGFGSTLDGNTNLVVNTAGSTRIFGAVGSGTALASLSTNAGGTTRIAANVTTSGTQTYGDGVTLANSATLTGSDVTFNGTVSGAQALTVNASGATTFGGTVNIASLTTDAAGSTVLTGGVTTTGAQTYNDGVTLAANSTLASAGNAAITLQSVAGGGNDLVLMTTGGVSVAGALSGVGTLTTSNGTNLAAASVAATGASLGGNVTTTGSQAYTGPVALTGAATVTGAGVTFGGTVTGAQALTVNSTGGSTTSFDGAVNVASLATDADGTTRIGANVTTTGAQSYGDNVTLATDAVLTGGSVSFNGTVGGAHALAVNSTGSGATTFNGAVNVASVTTNADGTVRINANVTTTGAQTYNELATVAAGTTLSAGGSLTATNAGNVFGNGTQFAVTASGGAGSLNVAGDFAGGTKVSGNATTVSLTDTSASTPLVVTGLAAAPAANVTLTSAGAMQVDAAALSPVANLTATTQNGGMNFLNSGTAQAGSPGVLATGALTLNVTGGALNSAADPLVINAGTPVVNVTASPAYTQWMKQVAAPAPAPAPAPTAPDALQRQAADVAGAVTAAADALVATDVRDAPGLLRTERLVFVRGLLPQAAKGPSPLHVTALRLPRCVDEQMSGQPGCR